MVHPSPKMTELGGEYMNESASDSESKLGSVGCPLSSSANLQIIAMCSRAWGLLAIPKMEVKNDGANILINSLANSATK